METERKKQNNKKESMKQKIWFFEKMNEINTSLVKFTRRKKT
jgi:Mg2+/Co2+ transporter CorB